MKNNIKWLSGLLLTTCISLHANSQENYLVCDGCSPSSTASNWTINNISEQEALANVQKTLTIINIETNSIHSYNVHKNGTYSSYINPPGYVFYPVTTSKSPSSTATAKANTVFSATQNFKSTAEDVEIPTDVIDSAWEFTECGYCANNVESYINSQASTVQTAIGTLQDALSGVGILDNQLLDTSIFNLESGGSIRVKWEFDLNTLTFEINSIKVTDAAGNNVPLSSAGLSSGQSYLSSHDVQQQIDFWLARLGFITNRDNVPPSIVTIVPCKGSASDPRPIPLCGGQGGPQL